MKSKVYVLLCAIVLCTIFSSAAWLLSNEHFNTIPAIEGEDKCEYILHKTELIPREDITSFAVDDEKISWAHGMQASTEMIPHRI